MTTKIITRNSVYTITEVGDDKIMTSTNPKYAGPFTIGRFWVTMGRGAVIQIPSEERPNRTLFTSEVLSVERF